MRAALVATLLWAALVACGGGGGGSDDEAVHLCPGANTTPASTDGCGQTLYGKAKMAGATRISASKREGGGLRPTSTALRTAVAELVAARAAR